MWEIVWYEQGRRRTRSTGTGCSSEAEKVLSKHLTEKEAVLELQWSQVNMGQGNIDFYIPSTIRSKKRRACQPIPKPLMTFLRLAERRSSGSGTVIEFQGKSVGDIKKSFAAACKTAGLKDVTPHTLRHTAITWLVQKDVPLWEVAGYVGVSVSK